MIKVYIDFDGVILDTWSIIIEEYYKKYNNYNIDDDKLKKIMLEIGWSGIISRSKEINDAIKNIKKISRKYEVCILTKVNSDSEKQEKKKFLLKNNITNMKFVCYEDTKGKYVKSVNDILIDDTIKNLDEWKESGGTSIFFSKNLNNCDEYGRINNNYIIIDNLLKLYDIIKLEMED